MATSAGGVVAVDGYTALSAHGVVWDITVAGAHNYYVSASETSDAVLVHNADELCSEPLTLDQFDQLDTFLREANDPALDQGFAELFDESFRVAQAFGASQRQYEDMLERLARLASENPETLRELAVKPAWLTSAITAGPGKFEKIVDAAVAKPLLRGSTPNAVFRLGSLSTTQLDEALPILVALSDDVPQVAFDSVLHQADVIGGIRQLKPGASPRVGADGKMLSVRGTPRQRTVKSVVVDANGNPVIDPVNGLPYFEADGVRVHVTELNTVVFPEVYNGRQVRFASVELRQDQILVGVRSQDFANANAQMADRVRRFRGLPPYAAPDTGALDSPVIDEALQDWFIANPTTKASPEIDLPGDSREWTWHHHETTGRLDLVDRRVHQTATPHTGGASIWGNTEALKS